MDDIQKNLDKQSKCVKCGIEIERGTTYFRNKDGSVQHAVGDYCPANPDKRKCKSSPLCSHNTNGREKNIINDFLRTT